MKRFLKTISFLAMAIVMALPAYAQTASISGKVIGRDGQPAQGVVVKIDSLTLNNGRLQIRESLDAKTGKNGEYSKSGLYNGRVMVSVIENGQPILTAGEKVGDEIFLADGLDKRIPTFDLTKAAQIIDQFAQLSGALDVAPKENITAGLHPPKQPFGSGVEFFAGNAREN